MQRGGGRHPHTFDPGLSSLPSFLVFCGMAEAGLCRRPHIPAPGRPLENEARLSRETSLKKTGSQHGRHKFLVALFIGSGWGWLSEQRFSKAQCYFESSGLSSLAGSSDFGGVDGQHPARARLLSQFLFTGRGRGQTAGLDGCQRGPVFVGLVGLYPHLLLVCEIRRLVSIVVPIVRRMGPARLPHLEPTHSPTG